VVHLDLDSIDAVGARVVQDDPVVSVLAADQQQEVDCSRHSEALPRGKAHYVEHKAEPLEKLFVTIG